MGNFAFMYVVSYYKYNFTVILCFLNVIQNYWPDNSIFADTYCFVASEFNVYRMIKE